MTSHFSPVPRWSWTVAGWSSLVFTLGTAVHGFLIIDLDLLVRMMELSGLSPAQATADAPGFLVGFRSVGAVYVVANALGALALGHRERPWLFWLLLATNATQGAGPLLIPREMYAAVAANDGAGALLPSLVTDVGGAVLTIVLVVTAWRRRGRRTLTPPPSRATDQRRGVRS